MATKRIKEKRKAENVILRMTAKTINFISSSDATIKNTSYKEKGKRPETNDSMEATTG